MARTRSFLEIGHFCVKSKSEVGQTIAFCRLSLPAFSRRPTPSAWMILPSPLARGQNPVSNRVLSVGTLTEQKWVTFP